VSECGLCSGGLSLGLGDGLGLLGDLLLLWLKNVNVVWKVDLWTSLASWVGWEHDLDQETEHTLAEQDVADSAVNELAVWLTGVDHEAIDELHVLGTLGADLTRHDNLNTLGTRLHDEAHDTVAGTADGETTQELVAEGLALGHGAETTVGDTLGIEVNGAIWETETLLDEEGQLADAATVLTKDGSGLGGVDDDLSAGWGGTDLEARVALLGELAGEQLVQLSLEDTVSDELALLGDLLWSTKLDLLSSSLSHSAFRITARGDCWFATGSG